MNVSGYIRVSGVAQSDKDGPVRQREAIARFAARHGLTILAEYSEAISGTVDSMERPQFAEMLTKILLLRTLPGPKIEGIVVECMDRLARDVLVSEMLLKACRENDVKVFCAVDDSLTDICTEADKNRTLLRQILAALAQWEKSTINHRLQSAKRRIKSEGRRCEGGKPYGHYPGEAETLTFMRDLRDSNNNRLSLSKIAFETNAAGYRNRAGRPWTKQSVFSVLTGRSLAIKKKARKSNARRIHAISQVEGLAPVPEVSGPSGASACAPEGASGVAPGAHPEPIRTVDAERQVNIFGPSA